MWVATGESPFVQGITSFRASTTPIYGGGHLQIPVQLVTNLSPGNLRTLVRYCVQWMGGLWAVVSQVQQGRHSPGPVRFVNE